MLSECLIDRWPGRASRLFLSFSIKEARCRSVSTWVLLLEAVLPRQRRLAVASRPCLILRSFATRLLVQGNSGSGKSHLLRRLLEQSAQWVQQCIVDPEGDFVTLADLYGHVVVDAARTEAELTRIAGRIRQHRVSVVLNLEGLDVEQQMRSAAAFLGGLFDAERDYWYPMLVVVDEAQLLRLPPLAKCPTKRASYRSAR